MKGQIQTIEAFITISIVALVVVVFFGEKQTLPDTEHINWKLEGLNAVRALDDNNQLRQYVINNDNVTIKNLLSGMLPTNINLAVFICATNCPNPSDVAEKIVSVDYLVSGDIQNYQPKVLKIYMWSA